MRRVLTVFTLMSGAAVAGGQTPPVRAFGATVASSAPQTAQTRGLIEIGDGRILLFDPNNIRQLVVMDSTLTTSTVVKAPGRNRPYTVGSRGGILMPYTRDSVIVADAESFEYAVIDRNGVVVAEHKAPRHIDMGTVGVMSVAPRPTTDRHGHFIYENRHIEFPRRLSFPTDTSIVTLRDSSPLLRVSIATGALDTLTFISLGTRFFGPTRNAPTPTLLTNPLNTVDDWAVLVDGSVVIFRGADGRLDWIAPDGTRRVTPPPEISRRILTPSDKQALLSEASASPRVMIVSVGPGQSGQPRAAPFHGVPLAMLPDYAPLNSVWSAMSDAEGNFWMRRAAPDNGPRVLNVFDATGSLVDLVRLPAGAVLLGFGRGVAFFGLYDDSPDHTWHLERVKIR